MQCHGKRWPVAAQRRRSLPPPLLAAGAARPCGPGAAQLLAPPSGRRWLKPTSLPQPPPPHLPQVTPPLHTRTPPHRMHPSSLAAASCWTTAGASRSPTSGSAGSRATLRACRAQLPARPVSSAGRRAAAGSQPQQAPSQSAAGNVQAHTLCKVVIHAWLLATQRRVPSLLSAWLTWLPSALPSEWMAPEVLRSEAYDERADVYSYGVVSGQAQSMGSQLSGRGTP